MKIPASGEKPKTLIDALSSNTEAVKISTRGKAPVEEKPAGTLSPQRVDELSKDIAASVKIGLAKYIADELDAGKLVEARKAKLEAIKAKVDNGAYLSGIRSEDVVEKLLQESSLENLIVNSAANEE